MSNPFLAAWVIHLFRVKGLAARLIHLFAAECKMDLSLLGIRRGVDGAMTVCQPFECEARTRKPPSLQRTLWWYFTAHNTPPPSLQRMPQWWITAHLCQLARPTRLSLHVVTQYVLMGRRVHSALHRSVGKGRHHNYKIIRARLTRRRVARMTASLSFPHRAC